MGTFTILCISDIIPPDYNFPIPFFVRKGTIVTESTVLDLTNSWAGYASLAAVVVAYIFVFFEDATHFKKSKPVLFAAGLVWLFIALAYYGTAQAELVGERFRHNLLEYSEILLFLIVAMSYVNVLEERQVFNTLRSRLIRGGWTLRQLFWLTGILSFFISPVADNMTTALIMGAVVLAVGGDDAKFVSASCVNVVVAANAGGAFSPFGDITTLMVWQAGKLPFADFFHLFPSALVTWLVPAFIMSFSVSAMRPKMSHDEAAVSMKVGARRVMMLFLMTIAVAVVGHNSFHLPPVYGMLFGLSFLKIFGYYLKISSTEDNPFDVFEHVQRIEWDTLLFFGGIILAVGGLGFIGYLELLANIGFEAWGPFSQEGATNFANVMIGLLSAIVDNIPLVFAVLTMDPQMSPWQWLLVTLTAGVGGSIFSIGSAAGVALMGVSRGTYTFASHLKFAPLVTLGYFAGIVVHYLYALLFAPQLF